MNNIITSANSIFNITITSNIPCDNFRIHAQYTIFGISNKKNVKNNPFVTTVLQYYNLYSLLLPLKESYFSY